MVRGSCSLPRRCQITLGLATLAVGLAASATAGCGLDRSGLGGVFGTDAGVNRRPPGIDATYETIEATVEGGRSGSAGAGGDGGGVIDGGLGGNGAGGSGAGGAGLGGNGAGGNGAGANGAGGYGVGGAAVGGNGDASTGEAGGDVGSGDGMGAGGMGMGGTGAGGAAIGTGGAPGAGGLTGDAGACPPCGPCERCSGVAACELDPSSLWDLAVVSASLTTTDPDGPDAGTDWDLPGEDMSGALPDPFCELDMPPSVLVGQTAVLPDTTSPNWGALMSATEAQLNSVDAPLRAADLLPGGPAWRLWIGDDDSDSVPASGETMCQFSGPIEPAEFRAGEFTRAGLGSCLSMRFKLTCRP